MATTYIGLSKTYQEQLLGLIEQNQKLAVDSVTAWAKATQPYARDMTVPAGADLPAARELLEDNFTFAQKLLSAQHSYWNAVLAAAEPALPKTKAAPAAK
jgi:hypothetical protein